MAIDIFLRGSQSKAFFGIPINCHVRKIYGFITNKIKEH